MNQDQDVTRRSFLKSSAIAAAAVGLPNAALTTGFHSQARNTLRLGIVGCGSRGTGAVMDAMEAEPSVELVAMGDVFKDRLDGSLGYLKEQHPDRIKVTPDTTFLGFDNYEKVLAQDLDVVILTAPPGFRPKHFAAAVEAGVHVFMEKPVATDAPGVRMILEASRKAKEKGLNVVAGTQRRHDLGYRDVIQRIHDGQIGDVVACYAYWNQGGLWMNARQPEWSDMEWQMRNWLYFTWLAGDIIVEQHIHNIDVCNWANDAHPVKAISLGGRQVRTDPAYGHVYDHFATEFEYESGVKMISMCRQIDGTVARVHEHIVGTKGGSDAGGWIWGETPYEYKGDRPNPYVQEHRHLYSALAAGTPINEGQRIAETTLTAIMGRMAAYTGQEITWDQAMASQEDLFPKKLELGDIPVPPVAVPGRTPFI